MDYLSIKSIKEGKTEQVFSIQNNVVKNNLYKNTPNYLVDGIVSKNSKHACVWRRSKVLTNNGYKEILRLKKNDRIAYLDSEYKIRLTKRYKVHSTGKKEIYKLTTDNGKQIRVSNDHRFLKITSEGTLYYCRLKDLKPGDKILLI